MTLTLLRKHLERKNCYFSNEKKSINDFNISNEKNLLKYSSTCAFSLEISLRESKQSSEKLKRSCLYQDRSRSEI